MLTKQSQITWYLDKYHRSIKVKDLQFSIIVINTRARVSLVGVKASKLEIAGRGGEIKGGIIIAYCPSNITLAGRYTTIKYHMQTAFYFEGHLILHEP